MPFLKKPKVLLLNPPGTEVYIRDYFCSKVSKTNYIYTPVDLLIVSARLKENAYVYVVDAIAEQLNDQQVIDKIQTINPDVIIVLISSVSWDEDLSFLKKVRFFFKGRIIGSGDVLMDDPQGALKEAGFLDAVLLDFTSKEIIDFCQGRDGPFSYIFMMDREMAKKDPSYTYDIPIPQHHLFPHSHYAYPFIRRYPFATVLTDFGCAFRCTFCIQSTLDFKARTVENVMEELEYLKEMGFKDIYFSDQTFAHNISRAQKLFEVMISKNLNLGWVAFYRTDLVQESLLKLMRRAGCHTLMFGIETANEALLMDYKKNIKLKTTIEALHLCRKYGIRTVGTFILGFPTETAQDVEATIKLSLKLPLDYASFNLPVPRSRTRFRAEAIESQWVKKDVFVMDQSGKYTTMGNAHLSAQALFKYRNLANRKFYLRPRYVLKKIFSMQTRDEWRMNLKNGFALLKESFGSYKDKGLEK